MNIHRGNSAILWNFFVKLSNFSFFGNDFNKSLRKPKKTRSSNKSKIKVTR